MVAKEDRLHFVSLAMEERLMDCGLGGFWGSDGRIALLYPVLAAGLGVPVRDCDSTTTGRFAGALDLWIALEFGRAGFEGMWPRLSEPRAIDPEVVRLTQMLPIKYEDAAEWLVEKSGSKNANVMGSVYTKQVDVGLASWPDGPELLISTKTMSGSFGKNIPNRFEEAYGDAKNLRERYPMAAHGFLFLPRSTIVDEPAAFEKAVHMLRQLHRPGEIYDAVCLLLADWSEGVEAVTVPSARQDLVPKELSPEHFYDKLIGLALRNAPVDRHAKARALYPGLS